MDKNSVLDDKISVLDDKNSVHVRSFHCFSENFRGLFISWLSLKESVVSGVRIFVGNSPFFPKASSKNIDHVKSIGLEGGVQ